MYKLGAMDETTFRAQLAQDGFTEVLLREWPANTVLPDHQHVFDARLLVLGGEFRLDKAGESLQLRAGQTCEVPRDQPHAEHYGAENVTLLVGRRYT